MFALDEERLGLIVGRVSATGRRALGVTALIRHILRAYLEGGLQPRNALQVGSEVLERHLGPDYACATVAVYDRATSRLTYAGAGMPAPIVLGSAAFEPATACAAPPIGMGVATGTRQTTILLPAGAAACLYTDGLVDARVDGGRYGYRRAWHALETLEGDADADALLDRVAAEADTSVDDIAAVLLRVGRDVPASASRRRAPPGGAGAGAPRARRRAPGPVPARLRRAHVGHPRGGRGSPRDRDATRRRGAPRPLRRRRAGARDRAENDGDSQRGGRSEWRMNVRFFVG